MELAGPTAPEHVGPRRDAASAPRQVEKCTAGAPIRGGADSPRARGSPVGPTDWAPASGRPEPERPSSGHRRRCIFPRVRPRRRGPTCSGAVGPGRVECWRRGYRPRVGGHRILSGDASVPTTIPGFQQALVEPCMPISSTRLSDWFHATTCDRPARGADAKWKRPSSSKSHSAVKRCVPRRGSLCRRARKPRARWSRNWSSPQYALDTVP